MADQPRTQPQQRSEPPRSRAPAPRGRAQPPAPGTPGWRVTPAPDGRGAHRPPTPPRSSRTRWWIVAVIVGLLAINLWISSEALKPSQIKIPYSPTFLNQLGDG